MDVVTKISPLTSHPSKQHPLPATTKKQAITFPGRPTLPAIAIDSDSVPILRLPEARINPRMAVMLPDLILEYLRDAEDRVRDRIKTARRDSQQQAQNYERYITIRNIRLDLLSIMHSLTTDSIVVEECISSHT